MPRSPLLDLYSEIHSSMKMPISGFSLYAIELFASARCGFSFHHAPVFASRIFSSVRLDSEMSAERRTPPTTTTSAILHTMSWHSMEVSLRPAARRKLSTVKRNSSSNGAGPLARPPKVFSLAPAGRTLLRSHLGVCPPMSSEINSLYAFAHPPLESSTTIVVFVLENSSAMVGNFSTYCRSTEYPTPVPFSSTNRISSNARTRLTVVYAQL